MKYKNRMIPIRLALLLLCMLPVTAYAHEVPDESKKGTIIVEMEYSGKAVTGGTLTIYRVGQIQENDGNYSFVKTSIVEKFSGNYNDISTASLSEDLAVFVKEHNIPFYATVKNSDGKADFTNLDLGLYLVVQTEASDGYEPMKPFLVSIPMNESGHYVYEVNAEGKFQLYQKPKPTTPSNPPDPTLPQTGQLNWPIPVLAVLGLSMFSVGWMLRFGRKKDSYEK